MLSSTVVPFFITYFALLVHGIRGSGVGKKILVAVSNGGSQSATASYPFCFASLISLLLIRVHQGYTDACVFGILRARRGSAFVTRTVASWSHATCYYTRITAITILVLLCKGLVCYPFAVVFNIRYMHVCWLKSHHSSRHGVPLLAHGLYFSFFSGWVRSRETRYSDARWPAPTTDRDGPSCDCRRNRNRVAVRAM